MRTDWTEIPVVDIASDGTMQLPRHRFEVFLFEKEIIPITSATVIPLKFLRGAVFGFRKLPAFSHEEYDGTAELTVVNSTASYETGERSNMLVRVEGLLNFIENHLKQPYGLFRTFGDKNAKVKAAKDVELVLLRLIRKATPADLMNVDFELTW